MPGHIRTSNAINRDDPINSGRIAWWIYLPWTQGGPTWYDVLGSNHGTLTSMGNSANGWRPSTHPGGFGSVLFDGSAGNVTVPSSPYFDLPSQFTLAAWVLMASQQDGTFLGRLITGQQRYEIRANEVGNNAFTCTVVFDGPINVKATSSTSVSSRVGLWTRIVGTFDGSNVMIYINGSPEASTPASGTLASSSGQPIGIGSDVTNNNSRMHGQLDDLSIWDRALSSTEVSRDFYLSSRGYPGLFNRT